LTRHGETCDFANISRGYSVEVTRDSAKFQSRVRSSLAALRLPTLILLEGDNMKECSRCKEPKPLSAYSKNVAKKDGLCTYCKDCRRTYYASYYSRPEKAEEVKEKQRAYRKVYGNSNRRKLRILPEEVKAMLDRQNGLCAICMGSEPRGNWCVDHNHDTGTIREILCSACNTGIGFLRDSADICGRASEYLKKHAGIV
jgi:hypothetical protein